MITNTLLGGLIAAPIAFVVPAIVMVLSKGWWVERAHKLAAQSDIALPRPLAGRVARFLRDEMLLAQLMTVLAVPLLSAALDETDAHRTWAAWFPLLLAGLPLYWAVIYFVMSRWPRWKASGGYRVTHVGSLPVRQAFTPAELLAINAGVVVSVALGAWGLWYVEAPAAWWIGCAASLALAFAAWRYTAASVMNRSSSASDAIELGWDDLLRFRQVRGVTAGSAWASAAIVYLIDCAMSSAFFQRTTSPGVVSYQLRWWPIIVPVAACLLLAGVFRQGRRLWRRAWLERDDP